MADLISAEICTCNYEFKWVLLKKDGFVIIKPLSDIDRYEKYQLSINVVEVHHIGLHYDGIENETYHF